MVISTVEGLRTVAAFATKAWGPIQVEAAPLAEVFRLLDRANDLRRQAEVQCEQMRKRWLEECRR